MASEGDLTRFQYDVLTVLAEADNDGGLYGLAIKDRLEQRYGVDVNHGRLYPNLDRLAEQGLVSKREIDKRTKGYKLTRRGLQELEDRFDFLNSAIRKSFYIDTTGDDGSVKLRDR